MMIQTIFQRHEQKYMIDNERYVALIEGFAGKMAPDKYGSYSISNLYYDTDRFDLIRASIEKPVYKEKIRLRCYGKANEDTPVYLELKKKFKGVVYKRRVTLPYGKAKEVLKQSANGNADSQILKEIGYFIGRYPVSEKVFLCYDRTALTGIGDKELRVTFDTNIRFRQSELRLDDGTWGTGILAPGQIMMEVKTSGSVPLWMSRLFSEYAIFPTSFSKYGTCYKDYICKDMFQERQVAASA